MKQNGQNLRGQITARKFAEPAPQRSTHEMKKRLIITLAMCIIHLMGKYFAARSITFLTIMTIPPTSLVVGTFFLVGLFTVAVWDFCGVFKLWGKYKIKAVIPFALCLLSFFLGGSLSKFGLNHRIAAFQAELPAFEKKAEGVIEDLRVRSTSGSQQDRSHHFGQYDGFNIYAVVDTNGVRAVCSRHYDEFPPSWLHVPPGREVRCGSSGTRTDADTHQ